MDLNLFFVGAISGERPAILHGSDTKRDAIPVMSLCVNLMRRGPDFMPSFVTPDSQWNLITTGTVAG